MPGKNLSRKQGAGKKGESLAQAGLEYLLTYGWAIVLVAAVVGVLVFTFQPGGACSKYHSFSHFFEVESFDISGSDSEEAANKFSLVMRSRFPATITSYTLFSGNTDCTGNVVAQEFEVSENERFVITGELAPGCQAASGECYRLVEEIGYENRYGLAKDEEGRMQGKFASVSNTYSATAWERTSFGEGAVLEEENNELIGSYAGNCPAIVPAEGELTFVPAASYETWSLPSGCSTGNPGGRTGDGFGVTYCNTASPNLAHGWYHAELLISPIFADRPLYLVGDAVCNDLDECPEGTFNNGICINDNFYFYVNGSVIEKGGNNRVAGNRGCKELHGKQLR